MSDTNLNTENQNIQSSVNQKSKFTLFIVWQDIKHWLFVIICCAIITSLLFYIYSLKKNKDVFVVSATFVISSNSSTDSLKNLSKAQEVSAIFSKILNRTEIKKIVLQDIGGTSLNGEITAELIAETNLIKLSVTSENLRRAYLILKSIISNQRVFLDYISEDVNMELLVSPEIANRDFGILLIARNTVLLLLLLVVIGIVLVGLLSYRRPTVKFSDDIEDNFGVKCLGIIPKEFGYKKLFRNKNLLISRPSISFQYVESVNRLCRKVRNAMHGDSENICKTLMVTSTAANEGKSTIVSNLAYALYDAGKRVVIIDLDLVNPSVYKIFSITEKLTVFKAFLEGKPVKNLVRIIEDDGLSAILNTEPMGETVDLLSSKRLSELLKKLKSSFDYIIIDCPPMNNIVDSELIADKVDCSLLVIKQNYMKIDLVSDAVNMLQDSKSKLLGCVLNNAIVYSELGGYEYYNKYKYGYYSYYKDDYYKRDV